MTKTFRSFKLMIVLFLFHQRRHIYLKYALQVPEQLQPVSPFKNNILPQTNLPYNSYPYNIQPYNAVPYNAFPYNAVPYNGIPFNNLPYSSAPYGYNNLNPYAYSAYNPTAFNRGAYNPYYLGYNPVGYKISNQEEPLAEAN